MPNNHVLSPRPVFKRARLDPDARIPILSVITVVRHDEPALARTWHSLANSTRRDAPIEWIVIDGSEPERSHYAWYREAVSGGHISTTYINASDSGPYDAMNEGIILARGHWLWFLNSGDEVAPSCDMQELVHWLSAVQSYWACAVAEAVGPITVDKKVFTSIPDLLGGKVTPCHQAVFVQRDAIAQCGLFDLRYHISADYLMMCRLAQGGEPAVTDHTVARFYRGGLSTTAFRRREIENFLARRQFMRGDRKRLAYEALRTSYRIRPHLKRSKASADLEP